jgi:outer membrane protein assembly factor BamB
MSINNTFRLCVLSMSFCSVAQLNSAEENPANDVRQRAEQVFEATGVRGGFIVHWGIGTGELTVALRRNDSMQVQGLDRDADVVTKARKRVSELGTYGEVAFDQLIGNELPYIDNLVNLFVAEELNGISMEEVLRVLVPQGVAYIKNREGEWTKTVKERPASIDEWSHYLHDPSGNAVAHDQQVGPPRHLQWVGSPRYSRHHDRMASMSALVSTGGRMFYIMDEGSRISIQLPSKWKLIARDAFNGTVLWKREIDSWQNHLWPLKSGPTQLSRRLVSDDQAVYVTLGYNAPVTALDPASGETRRTFAESEGTEEILNTNGVLFLVVRKGPAELADYAPLHGRVGDQGVAAQMFWNEEPRVLMAIEIATGKRLWAKQAKVSPLTLAADGSHVYFHDGEKVLSLRQRSGEVAWESTSVSRRKQFTFNFGPRLVAHDEVVLFAGGDGKMIGLDKANGKQLWESQHPNSGYQSPQDLMVVNGLVWCAPTTSGKDTGVYTGRDPKTGEVKQEFPPNIDTYWFHHRCYIAKATDNFLIPSRTGIEFVDHKQENWDIHHWVRGGCLYGVLPCNGLTYAPPHNCACYPEAKLFGFNALAPLAPTRPIPKKGMEGAGRLERGPAFAKVTGKISDREKTPIQEGTNLGSDWPMYRHDGSRSGTAPKPLANQGRVQWKIPIGGRLTPPVIAGGQVYVAKIDQHTLESFDEATGAKRWSYIAGGRIDSPPTIYQGHVIFGCTDGWVYNLRAADGQLAWRFRAAPIDRRTMAYEQLESLWPVHGSVLVINETIYCVAGRSNFLDGGLRMLRLNVASGELLGESIMDETNPETGNNLQEKLKILQMPVGLPDILSTDGKFIYMKSQKFDLEGNRLEIGPHSGDFVEQASVQKGDSAHLFAPMGFLDDSWFHRSYWVYGRSFAGGHGGYYQAGRFAPSGQIMVQGNGYVYGYGRKPEYLRWTTTMEHQLFKAEPNAPEIPEGFGKSQQRSGGGNYAAFEKSESLNPAGKPLTVEAWITATKPNGVILARGGPSEGFALTLSQGRPEFLIRAGGKLATVTGPKRIVGGWHHLVGVLDEQKKLRLYVDGERVAEGESTSFITKDPAQGLEIGLDDGTAVGTYEAPHPFAGIIDEVRLYTRATDDQSVSDRFKDGSELHDDACLVVTFDDGTARDFSIYRNNGTLEGGTVAEGRFGKGIQFAAQRNATANAAPGNSLVQPKWTADIPIYVRAMVLSGAKLFVAGPLDLIDEEATFKQISQRDESVQELLEVQDQALNGKFSGLLLTIDCETGAVEHRLELGTLPAWDGLAGANGRLYLSTTDGQLVCIGE